MIGELNQLSSAWLQYFGAAVLQNTIFLAIVFLALYALKNASAQTRYIVATAGLLKLLLPPFVPLTSLSVATGPTLSQSVVSLVTGGQLSPTVSPSEAFTLPNILSLLFLVWLVGAVVYLGISIIRTLRVVWTLRTATPIEDPDIASHARFESIQLFRSDNIAIPLTIGVFPKKVFVPASWNTWSPEFREAVMRHEVAHIHRLDGLAQFVQTLAGALYFFHPLVWLLNKQLRTDREMACDDSSAGYERSSRLEYSKCLVAIAESTTRYPLANESVSALLRRKSEILARVHYQTKEGIMRSVPKKRLAVVLTVLAFCVVPLSWYVASPTAQPTSAGEKKASDGMSWINVDIQSGKTISIEKTKTTLDDFEADFKNAVDRDPEHVVTHLKCADDLPMSVLFKIQRILISNGFTKVEYEDRETEKMPLVLPNKELVEKTKSIPAEHIADVYVSASTVVLGDKKVSVDDLAKLVDQRLKENPYLIVSIHAKPDATYKDFIAVLKEVKRGNAQRIFINQPAG